MGKMTFTTTLTEKRPRTPGVSTFRFMRPAEYEFTAGQWFVITFPSSDGPLTKHFTHSSSPTEPFLEFTTRLTGSPFKNALDALPIGSEVQMEGPFGTFVLSDGLTRVAFLTGGIGVTPVRSILRWLADTGAPAERTTAADTVAEPRSSPPETAIFYGNLSEESIAFGEELSQIAATLPNVHLVNVLSQPSAAWMGYRGHISADIVRTELADPGSWTYYLSGPPPMVEAMRAMLGAFEIPRKTMVIENFEGYAS